MVAPKVTEPKFQEKIANAEDNLRELNETPFSIRNQNEEDAEIFRCEEKPADDYENFEFDTIRTREAMESNKEGVGNKREKEPTVIYERFKFDETMEKM